MTPKGGRVDQRTGRVTGTGHGATAKSTASAARAATPGVEASSRYTPRVDAHLRESPPWLPVLMLVLFVVGGLAIMARYLIWSGSNIPMVVGLACLLGGLYTATKWR